jgi:hypothetical protein
MSTPIDNAKQFLVTRIVEEAQRDGAPLNPVETEMLVFSEVGASEKAIEAAREFEGRYNGEDYETRIARLARSVYDRDVSAGRKAEWDHALDELATEDMYLFVMLERAGLVKTTSHLVLPDWRLFLGLVPALVCLAIAVIVAFTPLAARLIPNTFLRLAIAVLFLFAPFLVGKLRAMRARPTSPR